MKRTVTISAVVLVLLGGGIWLYTWWNGPAETREFTAGDQTTQGVLGSETTLVPWRAKSFTTQYPNNLRVITSNEVAQGMTTGQYLLGAVSLKETDQLAVTVGTISNMTVEDLPSVKLRRLQTDSYEPTTRSFAPDGAVVFQSKETYETALFWRQGTRYAEVVVSGSSARSAELEQALQTVVTNWQWR